ncbi:P-type ATPase [Didymosphaeria variabile]|uniref:P-type Na(+) transporter n=1 Tax=Didymosphaeria variabile TaxID=1932322 RepID=A0A9W8XHM8_9PLEO|nr:P-type ATPase [Didymosphaeria variabile]KAJ4349576.1 P-type ATPase [Didymosphaeria variabile]
MGKEKAQGPLEYDLEAPAHTLPFDDVLRKMAVNQESGLSDSEVKKRKDMYGLNQLDEGPGVQPFRILVHQVANALTLVLIMAMVASFAIKSWIEGGVITFVILLNIIVGFFQEFSAEKTLSSIRALGSPTARAIRNGQSVVVPTIELVPGDIVELITGNTVPADLRLIECVNLETDEALLTGESLPVAKTSHSTFDKDMGAGDRLNITFSSSTVTKGRAKGIVIAIGMGTEIGKIAAALKKQGSKVRAVKRKEDGSAGFHRYVQAWALTGGDAMGHFLGINTGTPLQKKLSKLALLLFGIACVCALIVEAANKFSGKNEVVIYAVATGLSMIPASLIVVLTITMAVGTKHMSQRNVIVRKLDSLEALGAVTNICSDKTGTLTQGRMVAKAAWVAGRGTYSVGTTREPFDPTEGSITYREGPPCDQRATETALDASRVQSGAVTTEAPTTERYMNIASMANVAHVQLNEGKWTARGDPTEIAIQVFASRFGWNRHGLVGGNDDSDTGAWHCLSEYPFDSDTKRMSVLYGRRSGDREKYASRWVFTKGALERVLPLCVSIQDEQANPRPMTDADKKTINDSVDYLANQGLRVLCLASTEWTGPELADYSDVKRADVEQQLTFCGLVGLYDPPRPESADAVAACARASIIVHMLTGDHPGTATAIAKQVGIIPDRYEHLAADVANAMVMTAMQFDKLTDDEVDALPVLPRVIARCTPQTKVRMIEALHRRGRFAAMTGDGVNDSPSLVRSDVGIAMGQAGSDVAKDASDIILTDDNFASILNAVEEGRRLFDNIKRFILHVLAENIAQAATLLVGLAFKDSAGNSVFPLAPVQILWVIMATSGMPDMGLGMEVAEPNIMSRPPHDLKTGVFNTELIVDMVVYGCWMAALCLTSFVLIVFGFGNGDLGENCNNSYSERCDLVFRARATTFVCLTWFALFLAWEMVNFRRSFFRQKPRDANYRWYHVFYSWWEDSRSNPFLFWAIIAGFVTIFPTLYIPVINHAVFKHEGITWEWGVVVVEAILFFAGCEAWKWAKRIFFRRRARKQGGSDPLEAVRPSGMSNTINSGEDTMDQSTVVNSTFNSTFGKQSQ